MKVMYDHQIFAEQNYGGITRYFFEIARRINGMDGINIQIYAPLHINQYVKADRALKVIGKEMPRLPKTFRLRLLVNNIATGFHLNRYRPDIIHETYYHRNAAYSHTIPTVITIHDMIYEKLPQYFKKTNKIAENKARAVKRADHIICVSRNTQKDLIDLLGVDASRTSVIYHGASDAFLYGNNDLEPVVRDPYILFVGHRKGYKNFENLLAAYGKSDRFSKDFKLVCFGGGKFSSDEIPGFNDYGVDRNHIIHVTGDDRVLSSLYRHAQCFVFPSLYEGFGIPVLEAMACRCPIITGNESAIPEVASSAAEYFNPHEIESISRAMEKVLYDEDRKKALVTAGEERLKSFTWEEAALKTREIYDRLT